MAESGMPRSILIVRLSAIGDVIMASALIPALRRTFPRARLAWLTDTANADLLRHNPRLDRLFLWPRGRWRQMRGEGRYGECLTEFRHLVSELRGEDFDWVLDTQGLLKSGLWALLAGGKRRIGLGSREGSQWLMHEVLSRRNETADRRIGSEYLKLARHLGFDAADFPMDIVASPEETAEARELLTAAGVTGPYAVICPFTTRPQKHWFEPSWAELSQRLARETGLRVILLGGPGDGPAAQRLTEAAPGLISLVGRTRLGHCTALIRQARLLVGVDTGLTHLGMAAATPAIALFGATRPYLNPAYAQGHVLYRPMDCSPCRKTPTCGGEFTCMRRHTVESVMAEIRALLSANTAESPHDR